MTPEQPVGQTGSSPDDVRFTSWKEIAAHLGVSTKTAQRYEEEKGLPVKRIGNRVSVAAAELAAWQAKVLTAKPWWQRVVPLRRIAIAQALFLVFVLGAEAVRYWRDMPGPVAAVSWEGQALVARDRLGRVAWRNTFDGTPLLPNISGDAPLFPRVSDLDSDGRPETLAVFTHARRDVDGWDLSCLDHRGALRWKLSNSESISTVSGIFRPPFVIRAFTVFDSPERDRTKWVAATFVHYTDFPSVLLVADSRGTQRGQYWQVGHMNDVVALDINGDGIQELIAGGVQHDVERASLVVFDPRRVSGATQMAPGDPRAFIGKQPGTQIRTVLFPRTQISLKLTRFNFVSNLFLQNGGLAVRVYESVQIPASYLSYELNRDLTVRGVSLSVSFEDTVRELKRKRELDEVFPEREVESLGAKVTYFEGPVPRGFLAALGQPAPQTGRPD